MNKKQEGLFFHSFLLALTIGLILIFVNSAWNNFSLQLVAFLFTLYILKSFLLRKQVRLPLEIEKIFEAIIFTAVVLLLITSTGSLTSPLFFLVYFLLFTLSLLLEPQIAMALSLFLIPFFLLSFPMEEKFPVQQLVPLFSLPFITPLAVYLGRLYLKSENQKKEIKALSAQKEKVFKELVSDEKQTLLWLGTILRNHLHAIREAAENFRGDLDLEIIKKSVRRLEKLAEKLKEEIER